MKFRCALSRRLGPRFGCALSRRTSSDVRCQFKNSVTVCIQTTGRPQRRKVECHALTQRIIQDACTTRARRPGETSPGALAHAADTLSSKRAAERCGFSRGRPRRGRQAAQDKGSHTSAVACAGACVSVWMCAVQEGGRGAVGRVLSRGSTPFAALMNLVSSQQCVIHNSLHD